jgi:acyl carrier protein
MSTLERVRRHVAEVFHIPLDQITAETRIADLNLDSLDDVEFVMVLEEEFGLEIPDEEASTFFTETTTVGQLAEWIERWL